MRPAEASLDSILVDPFETSSTIVTPAWHNSPRGRQASPSRGYLLVSNSIQKGRLARLSIALSTRTITTKETGLANMIRTLTTLEISFLQVLNSMHQLMMLSKHIVAYSLISTGDHQIGQLRLGKRLLLQLMFAFHRARYLHRSPLEKHLHLLVSR